MKVRRVLIYEGPEERVKQVVDRSWCHDGPEDMQSSTQQPGGGLTIREISCEDITETDAVKKESRNVE